MVQRIDSEARRVAIAEATGRLLARGGGTVPGMRELAAETGVTTGTLQHHFRTKDDILLFTLAHHGRRWVERLAARAGDGPAPPPRVVLCAVVAELLPLDDERRVEALVAMTFVQRAAGDDRLRVAYREQRFLLHELVREQIARAGVPEPDARATELLQRVDGMRTDCLLLGADAVSVEAAVTAALGA